MSAKVSALIPPAAPPVRAHLERAPPGGSETKWRGPGITPAAQPRVASVRPVSPRMMLARPAGESVSTSLAKQRSNGCPGSSEFKIPESTRTRGIREDRA